MRALRFLLVGLVLVAGCGRSIPERIDNPDLPAAVEGNTAFALDLYGKLAQSDGNLFFSPLSITMAVGMTYAGARQETAKQMAAAMHFALPPEKLHPAFHALMVNIFGRGAAYKLSMANRLWIAKDYRLRPEYLRLTEEDYGAEPKRLDFAGDPEGARGKINDWVEDQTNDKIKDLIPKGGIQEATRVILTNAVYFKGNWLEPFKKRSTQKAPFHLSADKNVDVDMMSQEHSFPYAETDTLQVLELPYKGGEVAMLILLPKKVDGLGALEKELSADTLKKWTVAARTQRVRVHLPRFKVTSTFELADPLKALGMTDAFDPDKADLGGISDQSGLYIMRVIHKAFVDVNEEGTEAAAATGIMVGETAAPRQPVVFRADHPFLFLIRSKRDGSILFMGRLVKP